MNPANTTQGTANRAGSQRPRIFLLAYFRERPAAVKAAIIGSTALLSVLVLATALAISTGCATTKKGVAREQALYQTATNVVGQAETVIHYLPAPASNAGEIALGIATALLTAWNTHQHLQIRKLKNGNGKTISPAASSTHLPTA
jgi:hypothetical protein